MCSRPIKESLWFLVSAHVTSDPCISIFSLSFLFLCYESMINCTKIAGSNGSLPRFVLNNFFKRGMNVCPICEASLGHHTFLYGRFGLVPITACAYHLKNFTQKTKLNKIWSWPMTRNWRPFLGALHKVTRLQLTVN